MKNQIVYGLPLAPGFVLHTVAYAVAYAAAAVVNKMVQLSYSREDESQSDMLGVQFMADAGYDPRALVDVMDILAKAGGGKKSEFTSNHPAPGNRAQAIRQEVAKRYPGGVPPSLTTGTALGGSGAGSTVAR